MENPEGSTTVPRETKMTAEEAAPQIEETSSMQTVLQTVLREMRQLRKEQRRGICGVNEMYRSVNCKRDYVRSPQNHSSVANIRVTDPFLSVPVALVPLRVEILLQILLSMTNRTALPRYRRRRCQPF